ncbi:MAG: glycosyltransferase family 4 protein [Acidobacteria bacterium]|nr:glycosyltransferase family 4 protein [Acidobacteriota bacterium]
MPRPLVLTETYPPDRGGMAQSCDRIVRGLRLSDEVDIVHFSRRHAAIERETHERGMLIRCPADDDPGHWINLLWNELRDTRPSHVVAFGGHVPLLAAPSLAAWSGAPLLTMIRGNDFDAALFSARRGWILRDALSRSALVTAVSRDHVSRISALLPEVPVRWIPNGIDTTEWKLEDHDLERAREWRAEHVAPGRRVLGLFGQLKSKKGGSFFLDALRRAGCDGRFHLLLVGEAEPEMLARLLSIESAASWTHIPFVDRWELLPFYAACDLVVIPSHYDGLPNVLLEAGALGVPLLASTAGAMPDLLDDEAGMLLFRAGDPHDCRRAIEAAAAIPDEELRASGARLAAKIAREFDATTEATRYRDLLRDTARNRDAGNRTPLQEQER